MSDKPNMYSCIVTGNEKYIPPSLLKNKLKKYGDIEEFRKHYISKEAAKLLKNGNTVTQVRELLNAPEDLPSVDVKILHRLKMVKTSRSRKGNKEAQEALERQTWLNSAEFKNKMLAAQERKQNMSFKQWVEENTGGPDKVWLTQGRCCGTCIRPDVFVSWNDRACDGCPYYDYCLCRNRRLSHEKKRKR